MLKAVDLKKQYKPKNGQVVNALDGVTIDFAETGMVFILGKSGSGKSTLLNVLGGLDKYDSGEVIVKGKSSKDFSQADFDSYRNTFIGFIFQEYNILQEFSVEKNIGLALELQGKKADKEAINALIEQVDLKGYGKRKPNTLSGGQKQRVAIARALVKNPEIIMADEPTGALDSKTGAQVLDTLKKLSKEKLVIVVSHDREFAEYYGDRIIELSDGKIISDQFKHEVKPKNNDGIEIVDDKILTIKKGMKLTENNLDEINRFLLNQNDDIIISVDEAANKEFKKFAKINDEGLKETFNETTNDDVKLKEYDGSVKLIRSKLPMKDSVKMGASGLKTKRFRLVMTILLSAIAFGLFGLADTMASYNKIDNTTRSLLDSKIDYASLDKNVLAKEGRNSWTNRVLLNDDDYKMLTDKFNINFLPVYSINGNGYDSSIYIENFFDRSYFDSVSLGDVYGASEGNFEEITSFGSLTGEIATSDNEVVITKYLADSFIKAGYKNLDDSTNKVEISDVSQMIGKKLRLSGKDYTIKGILDTNFDYNRYDKIKDGNITNIADMLLQNELYRLKETSMHTLVFLRKGYYSDNFNSAFVTISNYRNVDAIPFDRDSSNIGITYLAKTTDVDNITYFVSSKTTLNDNEFALLVSSLDNVDINPDKDSYLYNYMIAYYGWLSMSEYYRMNTKDVFYQYCNDNYIYSDVWNNLYYVTKYYDLVDEQLNPKSGTKWNEAYREEYEMYVPYDKQESLKTEFEQFLSDYNTNYYNKYYTSNRLYYELLNGELKELFNSAFNTHTDYTRNDYAYRMIESVIWRDSNFNYTAQDKSLIVAIGNYFMSHNKDLFKKGNYEINGRGYSYTYNMVGISYVYSDSYYGGKGIILSNNDKIYDEESLYSGNYKYVIGKINNFTEGNVKKIVKFNYENTDVQYHLNNSVMESVNNINDFIETASKVFLYVGIGFAVFASLLLLNFISISISYKKREIGILRAIGARGMDVFKIFFSEAFIIALINFVFAFIGCFIACFFINRMFRNNYGFLITILHVGIRQLGLMLAVSILVAFISSFLPVYITAHKKPIDAIRSAE